MNKKLSFVIICQTILIITLFWVLIFYGKDEYEAYQSAQEEEIETPSRVSEKQGVNTVALPKSTQVNSGIQTAKIMAAHHQGDIKSLGEVIAIDGLIDTKLQLNSLQSAIQSARQTSTGNIEQHKRLKYLNADDKIVSDLAVQQALSAVNADNANIKALELQLKNLQANAHLQWGETLANTLNAKQLPPHLSLLLTRKNVLVQISLPTNIPAPAANSSIKITPLNETESFITAYYVAPAKASDANGFGRTYYYSAPADALRIGMRVTVETKQDAHQAADGVIIPSQAAVWYAGNAWAYFKIGKNKENADLFVRKPIATDTEVDTGWFNQGMSTDNEVVVSGAQLLLSEEFKYLIKNENDD
jgi:hypothetical protein